MWPSRSGQDSLTDPTKDQIVRFRTLVADWLTETFQLAERDGSVAMIGDASQEAKSLISIVEGAQISARFEKDLQRFDEGVEQFRSRLATKT